MVEVTAGILIAVVVLVLWHYLRRVFSAILLLVVALALAGALWTTETGRELLLAGGVIGLILVIGSGISKLVGRRADRTRTRRWRNTAPKL
jgi:hypothetical protein